MLERVIWRGLSLKVLSLTIVFVMLAEIVLFVPSMAVFRQNWLQSRVDSAQLLTLAVMGVPDFQGSQTLSERFMLETDVTAVVQKRDGMTEAVLGMAPADAQFTIVDMRDPKRLPDIGAAMRTYLGSGEGYLRVLAEPSVPGADSLEIILPNSAAKRALVDYGLRILALSALIAFLTGGLIYLALSLMIVRPVKRLAGALEVFRKDPTHKAGRIVESYRNDEIGQLEREFIEMKAGIRGALKQQDRLATLGLAVAKINHDLRNVLTSAQLISDRLATNEDPRVARMGERLVRAVDRGVKLCAETLNYSKSDEQPPELRPLRLATLVGEAAGDVITGARPKVIWTNNVPRGMMVMADPDDAYRIFSNLFRNAVQAMETLHRDIQSQLTVSAETVSTGKNICQVIIRVADNGPGLPERAQETLFTPFSSGARGGTGLGLAISKELAVAHGGDLRLETTGPDGTVFAVVLPGVVEVKKKVKAAKPGDDG